MPTYSYRCKNCGHILEAFQSMSDASLKDCPSCSKPTLERVLLSAPSFKLKGGGWYKTDYAKESTVPVPTAEPIADKSSEKNVETKQASASETKQEN